MGDLDELWKVLGEAMDVLNDLVDRVGALHARVEVLEAMVVRPPESPPYGA